MESNNHVEEVQYTGPTVQELGESEFQTFIFEPGRLNIVVFYANWCPACRHLDPRITAAVHANAQVARLGKINVDQAPNLSQEQGVSSYPDVRFYVDGRLVHQFIGSIPQATIENLIAEQSAQLNAEMAGRGTSGGQSIPTHQPSKPKPIEEAMKPMTDDWLPPGMTKK